MLRRNENFLKCCREFIWPCLEHPSEQIEKEKQYIDMMEKKIASMSWRSASIVLEEARRLASREDERRKTAETKATIYLAILGAMVPLSAVIVKDLSEYTSSLYSWQAIVLFTNLAFAVAYLLADGWWMLRTIRVTGYVTVDVEKLLALSGNGRPELALIRAILRAAIKNRSVINDKVSSLLMAHHFVTAQDVLFERGLTGLSKDESTCPWVVPVRRAVFSRGLVWRLRRRSWCVLSWRTRGFGTGYRRWSAVWV